MQKNMAAVRKLQKEPRPNFKVFSKRWLELDIMKDWLLPHNDPVKAICKACNKVINAGKSELVKHASGQKHAQKLLKLKSGKSQTQEALDFITNSLKIEMEPGIEAAEEKQSNAETARTEELPASVSDIEAENCNEDHQRAHQKKQIELLSRIASALDRIANSQEALVKLKTTQQRSEVLLD